MTDSLNLGCDNCALHKSPSRSLPWQMPGRGAMDHKKAFLPRGAGAAHAPPGLDEAIAAAQGLTDQIESQIAIAAQSDCRKMKSEIASCWRTLSPIRADQRSPEDDRPRSWSSNDAACAPTELSLLVTKHSRRFAIAQSEYEQVREKVYNQSSRQGKHQRAPDASEEP